MRFNPHPKSLAYVIAFLLFIFINLSIQIVGANETEKTEYTVKSFTTRTDNRGWADFTITLSEPLVDESVLYTELSPHAIQITPKVQGKARWLASDSVGFFFETALAPSVDYTIELSDLLSPTAAFVLVGKRKFIYSTKAFQVKSAEVKLIYDEKEKKAKAIGTIEFNYTVSLADLQESLSILAEEGNELPYTVKTQSAIAKTVIIEIEEVSRILGAQHLHAQIANGFKSIGAEIGIKAQHSTPMKVVDELEELQVNGAHIEQRKEKPHIRLWFNKIPVPIPIKVLEKYISLNPALPYELISMPSGSVEIHADFKFRADYTLHIKRGVTSTDGSTLKEDYVVRMTVPDLKPHLRLVQNNFFLPRKGDLSLDLATVNVERVKFGIMEVYLSSLPELVHTGVLDIPSRLNQAVITPLPFKNYISDKQAGIFKIVAEAEKYSSEFGSTRVWVDALEEFIIVTDLGIVAKRTGDELSVWVNSLASLQPIPHATVEFMNNQELFTGITDTTGFVKFSLASDEDELEGYNSFLLTVAKGDDFSFLRLDDHQILPIDFYLTGAPYLKEGYEAFLYTERAVYRPGETVNLVGIVRGKNNEAPTLLPTRIEVLAPHRWSLQTIHKQTGKEGACEVQIPLSETAQTGVYTATMWVSEQEIGQVSFQVEEFMPDRMKVSVASDKTSYMLADEVSVKVEAVNLFGSPAAGQKVEASFMLEAVPYVPNEKWRSFDFSDTTRTFERQWIQLGKSVTGIDGKTNYRFTLPNGLTPPSLLNGVVTATVSEVRGRAVTAAQRIVIHPYSHYVGIKRPHTGTVKRDEAVTFNYIVVNKAGEAEAGRSLKLTVFTIARSLPAYLETSKFQATELESHTLTSTSHTASFTFTPSRDGEHRVEIEDIASGAKISTPFYVSEWGGAPWSMENPSPLDMTLDKSAYHPGETAMLHIKAPFPGKLLLTIEREKVLSFRTLMLKESTAAVKIPVQNTYAPNVYLSATLIRSTESLEKDAPARAFGIIPLKLDAKPHQLTVEIDAPEETLPNREVDIKFRVRGGRTGHPYQVSIAAVDEGVLQLTNFKTPNPHAYFYQQRMLDTNSYEFYTAITKGNSFPISPIESLSDLLSPIESLSDLLASMVLSTKLGQPVGAVVLRVKPVSLWSGLMTTDANGQGNVSFKVPQFNGTLRVMAVAFSGADYGSATGQIKVREPVVLTPTFPRFLSGGDRIRVPVTLFNGTGTTGDFTVELQAAGPVKLFAEDGSGKHPILVPTDSLQKQLKIAADTEGHTYFDVSAHDTIGVAAFNLSASGNGETTKFTVRLPLRSAAPPVTKTGYGIVREGEPADFIFPANLRAETSEFALTISPLPAVKFAGGLHYLIQYPHGCLEQTTSRVFPLLYFSDLARTVEPILAKDGKVDEYIKAGITKLENMLTFEHHFSYWPGGSFINNWSSIYAAHFLVEARMAGYKVADRVYNRMLEGLRYQAKQGGSINTPDEETDRYSLAQAAYACYVLAAAGQSEKTVMHYLKNNRLNELNDYSQFQLAGAFALSGDMETALAMLPVWGESRPGGRSYQGIAIPQTNQRETGRNFDSPIRAHAIMLDVLSEVTENHPAIPALVESLSQAASVRHRWGNTQENAFAFLALGKILKKQSHQEYSGTLTLNGTPFADFDATSAQYTNADWDGARMKLKVKGKGTCYYYWTAFGVGRDSYIEEYGRGLQVNRRYFNADGTTVNTVFKQGELVVAEITVKALTSDLENVAVVDMLPAGFEIENARLASRASLPWLEHQAFNPDYIDIRDDRLIFFGAFPRQQERKFYYALRAVTQGTFTVPPVSAEAMYDPTKSVVASSGMIKIVE